jgi:Protein of unknown function (DUF1353)
MLTPNRSASRKELITMDVPWTKSFTVTGGAVPLEYIDVAQMSRTEFALRCSISYRGDHTGLEGKVDPKLIDAARTVTPGDLPTTDLASVPGPLRWLVNRYGVYTPAAIVHDRLIGADPSIGISDVHADRFFRFMLRDLGVRWLRRWMMWAAVAMRTRWSAGPLKRVGMVIWALCSIAGVASLIIGATSGSAALIFVALASPLVLSVLWGRQYGAGLVAALAAPWVGPPTLFAAAGYAVYIVLEALATLLARMLGDKRRAGTEPVRFDRA